MVVNVSERDRATDKAHQLEAPLAAPLLEIRGCGEVTFPVGVVRPRVPAQFLDASGDLTDCSLQHDLIGLMIRIETTGERLKVWNSSLISIESLDELSTSDENNTTRAKAVASMNFKAEGQQSKTPSVRSPLQVIFNTVKERNTFIVGMEVILSWYKGNLNGGHELRDAEAFGKGESFPMIDDAESVDSRYDISAVDMLDPIPSNPVPYILRNISNPSECHRLREVTFIGRSVSRLRPGVDLVVKGADVSRIQCRVEVWSTEEIHGMTYKVFVFDEGSYSGTLVDGVRLRREKGRRLLPGSFLRLGDTELWVLEYNSSGLTRSKRKSKKVWEDNCQDRTYHDGKISTRYFTVDDMCVVQDLQRCISTSAVEEWMKESIFCPTWGLPPAEAGRMRLKSMRILDEQRDLGNCLSQRIVVRKKDTDGTALFE
ncbi:hypothetical protein FOL47_008677 [Perkinsus chesapeaki]|uniref:FHA domain-containing protein n=1 Tax=Perkinsus chesapeaki TaxID=330153 RepID=A0A7J6MT85_PERCH|nr:hypothetical protein FOL47_008677 [Perkinsus chesapeaki]